MYHLPRAWKITIHHRNHSRTSTISMAHIGNRNLLLDRMDFLIVADVFSKYFLVRKLANSTSAAVCAEIANIVTELGLPHIIRSDNGPCYKQDRMDFLIVADVFSKYFLVRKLANSISAAVCAEIATIVTELGLPHIIRSDNGPCYNSKEFQQLL